MKKGISLIALMITIVILIILLGVTTVSGVKVIERAGKIKFATELSYVQELADSYMLRNGIYPILEERYVSTDNIKDLTQFNGEEILNGKVTLYRLDMAIVGISDLRHGNGVSDKDVFLVSNKTGKVYYEQGYTAGGKTYYTMDSELSDIIGYTYNARGGVIKFVNNSMGYVNQAPKVTLSIPKDYEVINIIAKQNNMDDIRITNYVEKENYKIYNIENIENNYNLIVTYKKDINSVEETNEYSVTNFDNRSPIFEISDIKILKNNDVQKKYFNIESKSDNLSGIKIFKYENTLIEEVNLKEYFERKGIPVKDDIVIIDDGVKNITLYMEDNAGNFSYLVINI